MRLPRWGSILATVALLLLAAPAARAQDRLAFEALGDLWTVHADGTGLVTHLTPLSPGSAERDPSWSPDGERIAYTAAGRAWVIGAGGGEPQLLIRLPDPLTVTGIDWARDGRFAYVARDGDTDERTLHLADRSGRPLPLVLARHLGGDGIDVSPDGRRILYDGDGGDLHVVGADGSGDRLLVQGAHPTGAGAWSPDGTEVAYSGCGFEPDCGNPDIWVVGADGANPDRLTDNNLLDDTDPTWSSDGTRIAYAREVSELGVLAAVIDATGENDHTLDIEPAGVAGLAWEPSTDPIVLLPGFMGSEIGCDETLLWPASGPLAQQLLDMRLAADGVSNLGESACGAAAGPTGSLLRTAGEQDVYGRALDFLGGIQADGRAYAWDWRRSPADAVAGLDREIELARCGGVLPPGVDSCPRPPHPQVVLLGHGLGGLLARAYIDDPDRAAKVSRVLTLGTPYRGAPRALLPLAAGIGSPGPAGLDPQLDGPSLRELSRNLTGLYALWPAAAYGPWLTVAGRTLDRDGLLDYTSRSLGGNAALLAAALDAPADALHTNGVELRALAGAGRTTIRSVAVSDSGELDFEYGNGDGTVPLDSTEPKGASAPVDHACGVGDTALAGDPAVTERVRAFLLEGDPIAPDAGTCPAGGYEIDYRIEAPGGRDDASLDEAEARDEIERLDLGARQLVVSNTRTPVALRIGTERYTLEITPLGRDGAKAAPLRYGELSGQATISAGTELHVLQGGRELMPVPDAPPPPPPGDGPGASPPPPPPPGPLAAVQLTGLRLSPARFRAERRGGSVVRRRGTAVAYTLSRPARVRFTVERRATGRRVRGRCRAGRPRPGRGCVRFLRERGSFVHAGRAGANALRFSGRLGARRLAPGRYRLVATPAGGAAARAAFRIRR